MAKKKATKKTATKEVALVENKLTGASMAQFADYDMTEIADIGLDVADNKELFSNDILIPKVWLIQAMSELRKSKDADEGEFVDSQSGEVIAENDTELQFIVLKSFKRWQTFKMVAGKKEFVSSEIMVFGKNHNLPYEETIEGEEIKRRQVISAYVLLAKDAVLGINKPYIIDFASSSKGAGRILISDIKTLNTPTPSRKGLPCFMGFFKMTSHEESFNEGSAFVKHVKFGGFCPKESVSFLADCRRQLDVMENQIEIDDKDLMGEAKTPKPQAKNLTDASI